MSQFDKFTERAKKVLALAQEEAQRFNHNYIGTEHILLGLVREGNGVAARVLGNLGVRLEEVRSAVELVLSRGEDDAAEVVGLTPQAMRVLELAVDESRRLNHHYIGTEHLLLGLLRDDEGIAVSILESLGVKLEAARSQVMQATARLSTIPGKSVQTEIAQADVTVEADRGETASGSTDSKSVEIRASSEGRRQSRKRSFDRFTERARRVLTLAQEEATRFNHNYIGTEHILMGLVREGDGVAARALKNLGIQLPKVRSAVEFIIGRGDNEIIGEIGLTPRAKKVLELAVDEGARLNHPYVGTEHLLLGLVREGEGIAAGVLESLGVNLDIVRLQVMSILGEVDHRPPADQLPVSDAPGVMKSPFIRYRNLIAAALDEIRTRSIGDELITDPAEELESDDDENLGRFGSRARLVLSNARARAEASQSALITTRHVLLELLAEPDCAASKLLAEHGLSITRVIPESIQFEEPVSKDPASTPQFDEQLVLAIEAALKFCDELPADAAVGTTHLLAGLITNPDNQATQILTELGASPRLIWKDLTWINAAIAFAL